MSPNRLMVYFTTACIFCFMVGVNIILGIMLYVSPRLAKKLILKLGERVTMTQNPSFKFEDWGPTFGSFMFFKTASHHLWLSLGQEAFVGGEAPDTDVVSMEGTKSRISRFVKDNRMLVLNFGSCT
ncbi:hypothetical protein NQZ68_014895 [Dissostichus eleginoides]|nr:hypothetical protein NQZ68_014895 [Dissostichus eleginoides]